MAPPTETEKRKELLQKLAAAKGGSHKAKKDSKQKALEKAEQEAKVKAAKEAKSGNKGATSAVAAAAAAPAAPAPPPPPPAPSVYAEDGKDNEKIGIHLGISCDGCGHSPPLIGMAMKCRMCPDFDLCEQCYPDRLDVQREKVAAAAGMPGKGRHPGGHVFGARKAAVVMTREAAEAEMRAAADDKKNADLKAPAPAPRNARAPNARGDDFFAGCASATHNVSNGPENPYGDGVLWTPTSSLADELPMPSALPRVLGPDGVSRLIR